MERISYIYLMRVGDTDVYKIGQSINPEKRLKTLQRGREYLLTIVHLIETTTPDATEFYLHRRYEHRRVIGEWFYLQPRHLKTITAWTQLSTNHWGDREK